MIKVDWGEEKICSSGGGGQDGKLRLSNIYADHMVFQVAMIISAIVFAQTSILNFTYFLSTALPLVGVQLG